MLTLRYGVSTKSFLVILRPVGLQVMYPGRSPLWFSRGRKVSGSTLVACVKPVCSWRLWLLFCASREFGAVNFFNLPCVIVTYRHHAVFSCQSERCSLWTWPWDHARHSPWGQGRGGSGCIAGPCAEGRWGGRPPNVCPRVPPSPVGVGAYACMCR